MLIQTVIPSLLRQELNFNSIDTQVKMGTVGKVYEHHKLHIAIQINAAYFVVKCPSSLNITQPPWDRNLQQQHLDDLYPAAQDKKLILLESFVDF